MTKPQPHGRDRNRLLSPGGSGRHRLGLTAALFAVVSMVPEARADYVQTTIQAGGYLVEPKDPAELKSLYHQESFHAVARKQGFNLALAYRYSDWQDIRPHSYQQFNRLSLLRVGYETPSEALEVHAGRSFEAFIHRAVSYDGAAFKFTQPGWGELEVMGGWAVPDFYQESLFSGENDYILGGGKLAYTGLKRTRLELQGLQQGTDRAGIYSLDAVSRFWDPLTLAGAVSVDAEDRELSQVDASLAWGLRGRDRLSLHFAHKTQPDSANLYEALYFQTHQRYDAWYHFYWNRWLQAAAGYGVVVGDEFVTHNPRLKVFAFGAFATVGTRLADSAEALDASLGFERRFYSQVNLHGLWGVTSYDLSRRLEGSESFYLETGLDIEVVRGLELRGDYRFYNNKIYLRDNRAFFGIRYRGFRRL